MPHPRLALTAAEEDSLANIVARFPALVAALEEHVRLLGDTVVQTFQGLLTTEAEVDDVLGKLADRIVGDQAPKSGEGSEADALAVVVMDVLARHLVGKARDGLVTRLLGASGG